MKDTPSNWSEVTIYHKITHHTFLPVFVLCFGVILATFPAWLMGPLTFKEAFWLQWVGIWLAMLYLLAFGDYVMPRETYKMYRSGEWGSDPDN